MGAIDGGSVIFWQPRCEEEEERTISERKREADSGSDCGRTETLNQVLTQFTQLALVTGPLPWRAGG